MRTINIIRNSFYALMSFSFTALLGIVVRKYFTIYLSVDFLGLEGLFSNIVTMLSLAELGLTSIISYNLYRELTLKNKYEINVLMNIYRYIYTIIGCFIIFLGTVIFFFLPFIVHDCSLPWFYVQFVYVIQICTVLSSYFLAYKRTLMVADQKDYVCIRIDMSCSIISNILRLLVIIYFQSYVLFSLLGLFFNVIANVIIVYRVRKEYPFICKYKVSYSDIKKRNLIRDVKNLLIQKCSMFIYGGADSIYLSTFLGIRVTGLMANYQLIDRGIFSIMYKVLQGVVPSIGNLVYESDEKKNIKIFWTLDFLYLILGSYIAVIYAVFFHPFMKLFFGESFLLPESMLLVWALFVFLMVQFENLCNFRSIVGMFDKDRNYILLSAFVKIIIGVPAIYFFGVTGLVFSSLLSWCFIGYGRFNIVFNYVIKRQNKVKYLIRHFYWSILEICIVLLLYKLFYFMGYNKNFIELFVSLVIIMSLLTLSNIVLFYRTTEFQNLLSYLKNISNILWLRKK